MSELISRPLPSAAKAEVRATESVVTNIRRARSLQRQCAENDRTFTAQVKELDEEIDKLKRKRERLQEYLEMKRGQYDGWASKQNQRTFIPFSKAWNLQNAEMMQAKLPRELRDMIYRHLTDSERLFTWVQAEWTAQGKRSCTQVQPTNLREDTTIPQFLYADYVGLLTAREVVHMFYKTMAAKKDLRVSTEDLHACLSKDPFHVGFTIAKELQALEVYCKMDHYRTPMEPDCLDEYCFHSLADTQYIDQARLKADVGNLVSAIENKKHFQLRITLLQRNVRINVFEEVVQVLREVRNKFLEEGANVQVTWVYHRDRAVRWLGGNGTDLSIDTYFDLPCEERITNFWAHIETLQDRGLIASQHCRFSHECSTTSDIDRLVPPFPESEYGSIAHWKWCGSESEFSEDEVEHEYEYEYNDEDDDEHNHEDDQEGSPWHY